MLEDRRRRLRAELQDAYDDWVSATQADFHPEAGGAPAVDVSGCPESSKVQWMAYQKARLRLIEAYAELAGLA